MARHGVWLPGIGGVSLTVLLVTADPAAAQRRGGGSRPGGGAVGMVRPGGGAAGMVRPGGGAAGMVRPGGGAGVVVRPGAGLYGPTFRYGYPGRGYPYADYRYGYLGIPYGAGTGISTYDAPVRESISFYPIPEPVMATLPKHEPANPPVPETAVVFRVWVPADAVIWFNGTKTSQQGVAR